MTCQYRLSFGLLLAFLIFALVALPAQAATVTVVNTSDSGAGSLRQAIADANPGDTIVFNLAYPAIITLTSGQLTFDKDLTISGPGATNLTISGNNISRVFRINEGVSVSITGVTIAKGFTNATDYDGGGGIYNEGTLTTTDSIFSGNQAIFGGAIRLMKGTLNATNCTFISNIAALASSGSGAGIFAGSGTVLNVTNCIFSNNSASMAGALDTYQNQTNITNTSFSGNTATASGGGGSGGAINAGWTTLIVLNSTFSGNSSVGAMGQGGGGGIRSIGSSTTVTNSTFYNNTSTHLGGGIEVYEGGVYVQNSTFSGNSAGSGGGGINNFDYSGTLRVVNTIIANSTQGGNCGENIDASSPNNLSTDNSCPSGFVQVTPAQLKLGALIGNPAYYPLNSGSVAIDAGTNDECPTSDQRGVSRPQDGNNDGTATCDIGSYEALPLTNKLLLPLIIR